MKRKRYVRGRGWSLERDGGGEGKGEDQAVEGEPGVVLCPHGAPWSEGTFTLVFPGDGG